MTFKNKWFQKRLPATFLWPLSRSTGTSIGMESMPMKEKTFVLVAGRKQLANKTSITCDLTRGIKIRRHNQKEKRQTNLTTTPNSSLLPPRPLSVGKVPCWVRLLTPRFLVGLWKGSLSRNRAVRGALVEMVVVTPDSTLVHTISAASL